MSGWHLIFSTSISLQKVQSLKTFQNCQGCDELVNFNQRRIGRWLVEQPDVQNWRIWSPSWHWKTTLSLGYWEICSCSWTGHVLIFYSINKQAYNVLGAAKAFMILLHRVFNREVQAYSETLCEHILESLNNYFFLIYRRESQDNLNISHLLFDPLLQINTLDISLIRIEYALSTWQLWEANIVKF